MAYYEILFGSGFYWMERYVIKTDYPTTDYGGLTDCLIDYLVEKKHRNIFDWIGEGYKWDENGYDLVKENDPTDIIYSDTFVIGGNYANVLMHHGDFRINEITETEIKESEVIEC